jgi:hypothetical protein
MTTTDSAASVRRTPAPSIFESLIRAIMLEASALVKAPDPNRIVEPDPFSTEAPFLDPNWPRC